MTSLNTVVDFTNFTGSNIADAVKQDILDEAYRQTTAYLKPYGLSPSGDECKSAERKYAQAELMTRLRLDGSKPASLSMGGFSSSDNIDQAISGLIKQAEDILEKYVQSQPAMANTKRTWVKKVNG
jgi:hypothetical protein